MTRAIAITLSLVAATLASSTSAHADARGDAVLARARAVEKAQLSALAGTTLQMHTQGTLRSGRETHTLEARRTLGVAADGTIRNEFVWGKIDGVDTDEAGLRKASGAPKKPPGQIEALTVALAPLTVGDNEVTSVGPTAGGGYKLHVEVRRDASAKHIDLVVDEATGKKLTASLHPGGKLIKLADRAEMALVYAADGTPAVLRSQFAAKVLWVDREAELTTTRLP